ncbi:acyclic terpene utilization AtuA family protein, partial [uncultured Amaricoccus sp.]|uniref:acyclic terpene utilization AtuA family protein n=1 Tax=uncultured Amaricoccus sp. TaxID=339341 RepID=UPI00262EE821
MAQLVYRVVSACGALGYGYPRESMEKALEGRIDAIVSDAGSMDAGPYYLGTGTEYFEREAVKADWRHMVEAARKTGAPVILGSSGMAGGDRNVDYMLDVAKEVFAELGVKDAKVAVIGAELDPEIVIAELRAGRLRPTGVGPELDEAALRESVIVGQMGIHPILTALEAGAQYVICGRSCDIALFAADMIRRGIDAGLAYHVGHVLECGALACDPGSPSDCLVAEIYDDGSAVFVAPNPDRRCTPYSIAAHSLYEESHPQLQFYPEGILAMEKTEFFARDGRAAGIRGSRFVRSGKPWPWSIKLEGARRLGGRKVSLLRLDPADVAKLPESVLVYGRNGVQPRPVAGDETELGLIVETTSKTEEGAVLLASLLTHYLIHYGYPGRKATAGNIAYPLSPNLVSFGREDGSFGAVVPSGTRDPVFFANYAKIKAAVLRIISDQFPDALANATWTIHEAGAGNPVALVRTIDRDPKALAARHAAEVAAVTALAPAQ